MDELNDQAGERGVQGAGAAAKALAKIAKALIRALVKLIGVWFFAALGVFLLAIFAISIADVSMEERGTTDTHSFEPLYENPTVTGDDGVSRAVALTEPQALIDAYYKYMSADSHTKYYEGKAYRFSDAEQTQDFAGLLDYFAHENYFYLSSSFIQMTDELFHHEEFFYPEQIVKPVCFELGEEGFVEARRLISHEEAAADQVMVTSREYNADRKTQSDSETAGVWDWGLGSVLQYEPKQKDVYISCTYSSFEIDVDTVSWTGNEEDGYTAVQTHKGVYSVPVAESDTAATLQAKIDAYAEEPTEPGGDSYDVVAARPTTAMLEKMTDSGYNSHIPQKVSPADTLIAHRDFSDNSLAGFSNAAPNKPDPPYAGMDASAVYYPLNIPIMVAAATMSGNIRYRYDGYEISELELTPGTGLGAEGTAVSDSSKYGQWELDATDILIGMGCAGNIRAIRSGSVCTSLPKLEEETDEPWGFSYLDDYAALYRTYVPIGVMEDLDFSRRVHEEDTWKVLKELGLLQEYTGGSLSAVLGVSADDKTVVAKLIKAEAGSNFLDELMVGAVLVNRYYYNNRALSYLDLVAQDDGGQYACWANGSFQSAQPTERDYKAAELVLSGEFAIPSNVLFQSQAILGTIYLTNLNNPAAYEGTHYYCLRSGDVLPSATDAFGRPAKMEAEVRAWAEVLSERYGGGGEGGVSGAPVLSGADAATVQDIDSPYPLYAIRAFDVVTAVSSMQKMTDPNDPWAASLLGRVFSSVLEQIKGIFSAIQNAFPSQSALDTERVPYVGVIPLQDAHDTVYQAITFSNHATYTDAAGALTDSDDLVFLFVGKEGMIGLGTSSFTLVSVPSTGSAIEGFASPTTSYYAALGEYSGAHPYTILAVPSGTSIQSVAAGRVISVSDGGNATPSGRSAVVEYEADGKTYKITYGGLETLSITEGGMIAKMQQIGVAGDSGFYFSITIDGSPADPLRYFYQPIWSAGVPFADLLGATGYVEPTKKAALESALQQANNRPNTDVDKHKNDPTFGVYDKWHSPDYFAGGPMWECPWWAWGRGMQYLESTGYPLVPLPTFGNGGDYYAATAAYFRRGQTPRANAWVCWGGDGQPGHVAYVEAVDPDGNGFWVSEAYRTLTMPKITHIAKSGGDMPWNYKSVYTLRGFVYLDQPIR